MVKFLNKCFEKAVQPTIVLLLLALNSKSVIGQPTTCPTCWEHDGDDNTICLPMADKITLECTGTEMKLTMDKCVMPDDFVLKDHTSSKPGCDSIGVETESEDGNTLEITIPLECTDTSYGENSLVFKQTVMDPTIDDSEDHALITLSRGQSFDYSCSYLVDYTVTDEYSVLAAISAAAEGATAQSGEFKFDVNFYDGTASNVEKVGAHTLGQKMNFGVAATELPSDLYYTATGCNISLKGDASTSVDILAEGCPTETGKYLDLAVHYNRGDIDTRLDISYNVFEFKNNPGSDLTLECSVTVCKQDDDSESICNINFEKDCESED